MMTIFYAIGGPAPALRTERSPPRRSPRSRLNTPDHPHRRGDGRHNVSYQFWLYNPPPPRRGANYRAIRRPPTCTWTPAAPGSYLLSATAQDGVTGTVVNTMLWYTIVSSR